MKIDRARAIHNELRTKPKRLHGITVRRFAEKHFISIRTVYADLQQYRKLLKVQ